MPMYVVLGKLTDQGIRDIKDAPKRLRERQEQAKEAGISATYYYTMGEYDMVGIAEVPDEETAMARLLEVGMAGNTRTNTLRAFTLDEMERIIAKLPG